MIRLYVDRWQWLIPLVTSYGGFLDLHVTAELRDGIVGHLYEQDAKIHRETAAAGFRNDDSRLRSTRGRTLTE